MCFCFVVPPMMHDKLQTKSTKLWKSENLLCSCTGDLPINVTWFKNENELDNNDK